MTTNRPVHASMRAIGTILVLVSLAVSSFWTVTAQEPQGAHSQSDQATFRKETSDADSQARYRTGEVVVKLKGRVTAASTHILLDQYDATVQQSTIADAYQLWLVPEGQELNTIEDLNADPRVQYAEPNYVYHAAVVPNDPNLSRQWAHTLIRSSAAWDIAIGSRSLTIAIIDSGIDASHPDLQAKIVGGQDIIDGDAIPQDENGHGTHVAGIAAAVTNNAIGVAGTDWQAQIMPVRVLEADGSGTNWDIGQGIHWAHQNGANVLNLSLSGPDYSQHIRDAVNAAHAAGSLVVAAMGNCRVYSPPECPVANPISYPAAYDNTMAVAATTISDGYAYYSQYGNYCDVSAPGGEIGFLGDPQGILSTLPTYSDFYLKTTYGYEENYDYLQGTSMATAYVTGLATLIWSVDPNLTADQVQDAIQNSADDLGNPGPDMNFGRGRVNAQAALQAMAPPKAPTLSPIQQGWFGEYQLDWSDVPGASSYTLQEDDNTAFSSPALRYNGTKSSYQVSGQDGGTWYYRVLASNAAGDSPWSSIQWVLVIPEATTLAPIDNPGNKDAYELSWAPSRGAIGYKLLESPSSTSGSDAIRYIGAETRFKVTGQPGGTWSYVVFPYNLAGDGAWSNRVDTTVDPAALPPPELRAIENSDGDGNYRVEWKTVQNATIYLLELSPNEYFDHPTEVYAGTARNYIATSQPGGSWYYRVRASSPSGKSPWSKQQSVKVRTLLYLPMTVKNHRVGHSVLGIKNGGFEDGPKDWDESSSKQFPLIVNSGFPPGTAPHGGEWAAWLGGLSNEISTIQQRVTIPTDGLHLTYWHKIDSIDECGHNYDLGAILVDGTTVDKYDLCSQVSTKDWEPHSVNLGAYKGRSVLLQIRVKTNDSRNSNLFIDDVSLAAAPLLARESVPSEEETRGKIPDRVSITSARTKPDAGKLHQP